MRRFREFSGNESPGPKVMLSRSFGGLLAVEADNLVAHLAGRKDLVEECFILRCLAKQQRSLFTLLHTELCLPMPPQNTHCQGYRASSRTVLRSRPEGRLRYRVFAPPGFSFSRSGMLSSTTMMSMSLSSEASPRACEPKKNDASRFRGFNQQLGQTRNCRIRQRRHMGSTLASQCAIVAGRKCSGSLF